MRSRVRWVVLGGIGLAVVGLGLPAVQKVRSVAARTTAICRLKQVGLAQHNFHDTFLRFPGNGAGGVGLVDPDRPNDAPWHYQVLPYIEADRVFRNPAAVTEAEPVVLKTFLCPVRKRAGHVGGRPVADYAVNLVALLGEGNPPTADNATATLNLGGLTDGSSNTLLAAAKSLHLTDYASTDPAVDDSFLHLAAGGASRVGARYTVGATTVLKYRTAAPPADFLFPTAVRDPDTAPGVAADTFGGPSRDGLACLFLDGSVHVMSYEWMAADRTVVLDKPLEWGTPVAGTADRVSQFRGALTPNGREVITFE
jgi:hypothetical protein